LPTVPELKIPGSCSYVKSAVEDRFFVQQIDQQSLIIKPYIMKKFFTLLFFAGSVLLVSCKKENVNDSAPVLPQKKLKTTTLDENRSFVYNANGTIKEIKMNSNDQVKSFTYQNGKVDYLQISEGKKNADGQLLFNNGKLTTYNWTYYDQQGQATGSNLWSYDYNEKGLVKKITTTDGSYREYLYDSNNDLVTVNHFGEQGELYERVEYTYGNKLDKFPQYTFISCSDVSFFLPAFSKHLPESMKVMSMPNGVVILHVLFNHELDADGYEVKGKYGTVLVGSGTWEWEHSYE
jgi:YD repeat-containing protein